MQRISEVKDLEMVIFRTFLADRNFFWAEDLPGKGRFYPREQGGFIPGQTQHD